ncbi:MAG: DUF3263 domain-containing protein [Acidimicrobiales bacterium]|nr:DUF3263 domain-containing protein [Acidimicrobiales bacterium]
METTEECDSSSDHPHQSASDGPSTTVVTGGEPRLGRSSNALTDRDKAILDFERTWWNETGPKEALIRERFGLSATRYYQILNELLEAPEAYEYDPLVVRRLRRLRDRRRRARHEGYQASQPPNR